MADLQAALRDARAELAPQAARRHRRRAGARRPSAAVGGDALDRRPVGAGRRAAGAGVRDRAGRERRRAVPDPLARRGRSAARRGGRHLLGLGRRARAQLVHLHRARSSPRPAPTAPRRCRRRSARSRARCTAARRRASSRCSTRSRRAATRTRTCTTCSTAASGSWASAIASTAPRTRAPACCAARRGARLAAGRGRRGARGGRTARAARALPRPRAGDERRVLGRGRARAGGDPAGDVPADVRLRASRRLVGAHHRAEAHRPADPPVGALRRPAAHHAAETV